MKLPVGSELRNNGIGAPAEIPLFRHTVFGQVYEGMDVVDKIANCKVGYGDKPMFDVTIESIEIIEI